MQALIRRAYGAQAAAFVVRHGDDDAGGIFVRVNDLAGHSGLLTLFTFMDGIRGWRVMASPQTQDAEIESLLQREITRDPDIWIVEIEDKLGRHFLEEKIEGQWN